MPGRAIHKAAASGLSAEAFAQIMADPKRYQSQLEEFGARKAAAEDAEAVARERLAEAAAANRITAADAVEGSLVKRQRRERVAIN